MMKQHKTKLQWLQFTGSLLLFWLLAACTPLIQQPAAATLAQDENQALANVRQVLTQQLHADVAAVEVVEVTPETWPDACLGAPNADELCSQVVTPGYAITLTVHGDAYRYHTNGDGSAMRLVAAPEPMIGAPILTWRNNDESGCQTMTAGPDGVAFGPCGGVLMGVPYSFDTRQPALSSFADTYQSFTAETPAGTVDFVGAGAQVATPAEQRMMAEWARLVSLEAQGGRSGASWGLIFAWHREGGLAGFCDDVTGYVTGEAYVTSCRGNQPQDLGRVRLDSDQLATVYGWVDSLQPFEVEQTDPATEDAMTIRIVFSGAGTATANEAVEQAITELALTLLHEVTTGTIQPAMPVNALAGCLTPGAEQQLFVDEANAYCLLYPAGYVAVEGENNRVSLVKGDIMNHTDPRVEIMVEDVLTRTLETVAVNLETQYGLPGAPVERGTITVAGVEAVLLDNLPGQDLNRRVALIRNGRLYTFFFTPLGEPGLARAAMAAFYQGVLDSFRFLDATNPTPLPQPAASDVLTTAVQTIQALVSVNIRSGPGTGYGVVGKVFAGQTAQVTGVMPDNGWWRVICPDGSAGNCFVVNDPSLTQPTTAPSVTPVTTPTPAPVTVPLTDTGEAIIERVEVRILEADPVQVEAVIRGQLPDACSFIQDTSVGAVGSTFYIRLSTARQLAQRCIQAFTPFEQVVRLGSPEPATGTYEVRVGEVVVSFTLGR